MLLRRVIKHVKAQNWFAVAIDFVIVVTGVFVGLQVNNWNEARAFRDHERVLLRELRDQAVQNVAEAQAKAEAFGVGADAARRVLALSASQMPSCGADCWPIIVDLMHASQWQQLNVSWSTLDDMRREGLPTSREIIPAIEEFQSVAFQAVNALSSSPPYRSMVRRLISIELQDAYWDHCYDLSDGIERYFDSCLKPEGLAVEPAEVDAILADGEVMAALREWTSVARIISESLAAQGQTGEAILATIDSALGVAP